MFTNYIDRSETHFRVIRLSEKNKKLLFIFYLIPRLHKLLQVLVYPNKYDDKSYAESKTVLQKLLDPGPCDT